MKLLLVIILVVFSSSLRAQQSSVLNACDSLLLDAQYQKVINLVDAQSETSPEIALRLQNKKIEALIRLGKFDEAGSQLNSVQSKITDNEGFLKALTLANEGLLDMNKGAASLAKWP